MFKPAAEGGLEFAESLFTLGLLIGGEDFLLESSELTSKPDFLPVKRKRNRQNKISQFYCSVQFGE